MNRKRQTYNFYIQKFILKNCLSLLQRLDKTKITGQAERMETRGRAAVPCSTPPGWSLVFISSPCTPTLYFCLISNTLYNYLKSLIPSANHFSARQALLLNIGIAVSSSLLNSIFNVSLFFSCPLDLTFNRVLFLHFNCHSIVC